MQLIRLDANGVMKRPNSRDGCVLRRAAEMALPEVKRWLGADDDGDDERTISELMKAIGERDGFAICRKLDTWSPDAELVRIMDEDFIRDAEREIVKQWVQCVGRKQEFAVGAKVLYRGEEGEVVEYRSNEDSYGVRMPGQEPTVRCIVPSEQLKLSPNATVGSTVEAIQHIPVVA